MANISGFGHNQMIHQNMIKDQIAKSGQNAAAQTVSQGSTGVSKQAEKNKSGGVTEESTLSEAARKAIEQEQLKDASGKGGAEQAGKAAGKHKAKQHQKESKLGGDNRVGGDRHHFAPGDQQKLPDGTSIVHGDDETPSFEISATGTKRLGQLDSKEYVQQTVVETMPPQAKAVGGAMVREKTDNPKKREKFADLKMGDDKFSSQVEGVILKPAETLKEAGSKPARIRSAKDEKPMMVEDKESEKIAKEAAAMAIANGEQEAFVA